MTLRVIAHRGHKTEAPEQTMAAYRMAADPGVIRSVVSSGVTG